MAVAGTERIKYARTQQLSSNQQSHGYKCELCGMIATKMVKDQFGARHHYCDHHAMQHAPAKHGDHAGHDKHVGHNPDMFRDRFCCFLVLTIPIILYSDMIQMWLHFSMPKFPGSQIPFVSGSVIFFYGGTAFLKSAWGELKAKLPGMMTLISLAILTAFIYSIATTFFITGTEFFWELATLIVVMLFGHWMEMRSVSNACMSVKRISRLCLTQQS